MNLVNNYKNEICSMSLSADFKETLKQRCREELESNGAQGAGNAAEVSSRVKFYKYVSIAACLVAAVSTIGVVSLMSGNIKYRSSDSDNRLGGDNAMYSEDAMQEDVTRQTALLHPRKVRSLKRKMTFGLPPTWLQMCRPRACSPAT